MTHDELMAWALDCAIKHNEWTTRRVQEEADALKASEKTLQHLLEELFQEA